MTRLHEAAPALSLVLVLALPIWLRQETDAASEGAAAAARVADAVLAAPYRVGMWVGRDAVLPDAAVRLLRPNASLARQFIHLERGDRVEFVFIHCGDARDMLGHYPPVCYPSNGWLVADPQRSRGERLELSWRGRPLPSRFYQFVRPRAGDWAETRRIGVFNFFILPDGTVTSEIDEVSLRTHRLGAMAAGVSQVQLLTFSPARAQAAEDAVEVLEGMSALFETLGVNGHG